MRRMVLAALVLALIAASCSDGQDEPTITGSPASTTTTIADAAATTASSAPSTTTTTATVVAGIPASTPPPADYAEVQADWDGSTAPVAAAGRSIAESMLTGDFQAVADQFDETMAAAVSVEALESGWDQLNSQAPLGAPIMDRAAALGPELNTYEADLTWGDGLASASVFFDGDRRVTGLFLRPRASLPTDPNGDYVSSVEYRVPFEGVWYVGWGGRTELQNYHVVAGPQRHALDLLVWKDGATHTGDGTINEDYWAYGQVVVAPADGVVATVVDGLPDQTPQVGRDPANAAGNHVVIEVAEGEYVLIAHMQPGSIRVAEGDTVTSGDVIGLVGNSGNTSEPHIHVHLQDQPTFDPGATGLPLEFSSFLANGQLVERAELTADQFVANG